ncbi:hypothetical protein Catovirus_2_287 [Catovirus CTV1]|uniref:Uncharacterized protein n=1 Tax=Catovirus CTV1 TaxID=1977631 RepID=A0A1V0SCE9_9VIRU|nr:hypothetical protein Catovirus_2_287 [Catovirus CTV1]
MDNKISFLKNLITLFGFESLTDYNFKLYNYKITNEKEKQLIQQINDKMEQIKDLYGITSKVSSTDQSIKLLREIFGICGIKYIHSRDSKSSYTKLMQKDDENLELVGNYVFDTEKCVTTNSQFSLIGDKSPDYANELIKISEKPSYDSKENVYDYCIPRYSELLSAFILIIEVNDKFANIDNVKDNVKLTLHQGEDNIKPITIKKSFLNNNKLYVCCIFNDWIAPSQLTSTNLKLKIKNEYGNDFKKISLYVDYIFLKSDLRRNFLASGEDIFMNSNIPTNVTSNLHEKQIEINNTKNVIIKIDHNIGYLRAIYIDKLPKRAQLKFDNNIIRFDLSEKILICYKNIYKTPENMYILPLEACNGKMSFLNTNRLLKICDDITLILNYDEPVNCKIIFDTYNDYINNSYIMKVKRYLYETYPEYMILDSIEKITCYHGDITVVTHIHCDEFCPPHHYLKTCKIVDVESEKFRISEYSFVYKHNDSNKHFTIPDNCYVLVPRYAFKDRYIKN